VCRRVLSWVLRGVLLIGMASVASAQDRPLVSNVFYQSDLRQALEDVAAQAKVNIIADPSVQGVVSVTLDNVTVDKALDLLLAGTEYQSQATPDYYLVFSPDEGADMFTSVAKTRMVGVQFIAPETAKSLLPNPLQRYVRVDPGSGTLAVTAPAELLERILLDLKQIDRPSGDETVFVALDYVKAATARGLLPEMLQRFVRIDTERNTLAVTAPRGSREQILSQIRRLDVALPPGSFDMPNVHRTKIVKLNHTKALSAMNLLPVALANFVRADEESNTLAISAPNQLVKGIMADIAAIDVPRKHIMLDARVVVLERADMLDFGADWKLPTITAGGVLSDVAGFPWALQIGFSPDREFTNALSLTLNLLTQNNEATIIASPQVLAQDGKQAEIRVTTEEYFQITADSGVYIRSELEKIETGTILGITPQVGPNGELTLDMNIEVSDVVARGEKNLPVVSRRTARSTVQIQNGGTAAIAGLVDTRSQFGKSGIPGAKNLPILGSGFRTDTLNHQARQVAVFVTATLVDEHGAVFETGRRKKPPAHIVDDGTYLHDLEMALDQLGALN
jgi:type II secretory pathway component GspD/PulD (secretin)